MKYPRLLPTTAMVLAIAAVSPAAFAAEEGMPTPPVMTDTAPLPAQDRSSHGAIVFADSRVLAHQEAFKQANDRNGLATIGRNALRATMRAQTQAELAELREREARRFYQRGASSLDEK